MVDREAIIPLVLIKEGKVEGIVWGSEKTAEKSLEQGVLWKIDSVTQKEVAEEPQIRVSRVYKKDGWYEIEVIEEELAVLKLPSLQLKSAGSNRVDSNAISDDATLSDFSYLETLTSVISSRKNDLPKGSYTTHLFCSGIEKIKKKIGEEAIEVILASDEHEMVQESADLLYHLFVMLIQQGISPKKVIGELARRHSE